MWGYTPRQLSSYLFLAEKRKNRQSAVKLSLATSAARGNPKEIRKLIRQMERDT